MNPEDGSQPVVSYLYPLENANQQSDFQPRIYLGGCYQAVD